MIPRVLANGCLQIPLHVASSLLSPGTPVIMACSSRHEAIRFVTAGALVGGPLVVVVAGAVAGAVVGGPLMVAVGAVAVVVVAAGAVAVAVGGSLALALASLRQTACISS